VSERRKNLLKAFGCWDAWKGASTADAKGSPNRSGCIDAIDLISD